METYRLKYLPIDIYDNPVPSQNGDILKGQTTKAYPLNERMKPVLYR